MRRSPTHRILAARVAALLAPPALALALVPVRTTLTNAAAALALVTLVAVLAVLGDRLAGALATVSSALWFDVLLTVPYDRLAISHRADVETMVGIVVVGLILTELAARNRSHQRTAGEEADYVAALHDVAELVARSESSDPVVARASLALVDLLDLQRCRFEAGPSAATRAQLLLDGTIVHAGVGWPAEDAGLPGPECELPVTSRGRVLGRFVLTPTVGHPVALRPRIVAASLVELVGATLDRRPEAA